MSDGIIRTDGKSDIIKLNEEYKHEENLKKFNSGSPLSYVLKDRNRYVVANNFYSENANKISFSRDEIISKVDTLNVIDGSQMLVEGVYNYVNKNNIFCSELVFSADIGILCNENFYNRTLVNNSSVSGD